jgi:hypothetical protein
MNADQEKMPVFDPRSSALIRGKFASEQAG